MWVCGEGKLLLSPGRALGRQSSTTTLMALQPVCCVLLGAQVWYPTTVATLSRRCKELIAAAFDESVDGGRASPLLNSRLHDFGFRWVWQ